MKTFYIKSSLNSPEEMFDVNTQEFHISGQSLHTDVQEYNAPDLSWLEEYAKNPP